MGFKNIKMTLENETMFHYTEQKRICMDITDSIGPDELKSKDSN